jgi:hypothetical protein
VFQKDQVLSLEGDFNGYSDARVQDARANVVAPAGQRLRRKFPLAGVIMIGVFMAGFVVIPIIATAIAAVSG